MNRIQRLLPAMALVACADVGEVPQKEAETEAPVQIVSNACKWSGLVSKDTPDSCALQGGSPVSTEMRFVPRMGFVDGMSCGVWPASLDYATIGQTINGNLPHNAVTTDAIWFQQSAFAAGALEWVVFGSKRELQVRRIPWTRTTELAVAVDVEAGYGMVLDFALTCDEADLHAGLCRIVSGTIDGKEVDILVRSEPASVARRDVMLVAETIRFPESIDLDVGLLAIADEVSGGPRVEREKLIADPVDVQVFSGRKPIGNTWAEAVHAMGDVPERPVLAVFAHEVSGIGKLRSKAHARVATLSLTHASTDMFADAWQASDVNRIVEATFPKVLPGEIDESMQLVQQGGEYKILQNVHIEFRPTLQVRLQSDGGLTQLGVAAGKAEAALQAHGESKLAVVWDPTEVQAYAAALAQYVTQFDPACVAVAPGDDICWNEDDCIWYPDGSWDCDVVQVCQPGPPEEACPIVGGLTAAFPGGATVQVQGDVPQFALELRDALLATFAHLYPPAQGPTKFPGGDVRSEEGFSRTHFAAQALSHGTLFDVLYEAHDNRSRRHGLFAREWERLGLATDPQVMHPAFDLADYGIDEARWLEVQQRRAYIEAFDASDVSVYLDGLGLPYGQRAVGWHPTHLVSSGNAYGSMIEISQRWADLPQLAQELDAVADDQNFVAQLAGLISLTTAQATLTRDSAQALGDSASSNVASQTAAIAKLETATQTVIALAEDFEQDVDNIWNCSGSLAGCAASMETMVEQIEASCSQSTQLDNFLALVGFLASVVDVVAPVVGGLDSLVNNQKLIDLFALTHNTTVDSLIIQDGLKWIGAKKKTVGTVQKTMSSIKKIAEDLAPMLGTAVAQCEGTPQEVQLLQMQSNLVLIETSAGMLAVHSATLEGVLDALSGHVQHLMTSAQAHGVWAEESDALIDELDLLQDGTLEQLSRQRRFIRAACQTTQRAATQALADYKAVSDTLVTSAGRSRTSHGLTIPRSPGLSTELSSDRHDGYAISVWDTGLFSAFDETGGVSGTPFLTAARDRFRELVSDELCRIDGGPLDAHRWLVRRTVRGAELQAMLANGHLLVDVSLDDLLAGSVASGVSFDATETTTAMGQSLPLSGAIVLGVGYSACTGPAGEECCSSPSCRTAFTLDQPHLVPRFLEVPTLACPLDSAPVTGTEPTTGLSVDTCLAPVASHPAHRELTYVANPEAPDSVLVQSHFDANICNVEPTALPMQQLRGLPALGVYELAPDGVLADAMTRELHDSPPVTLPETWLTANGNLTGIEFFFYVGAESTNAAVYTPTP
ncbi:MAG: hypothetical protein RMA76_32330 [Deltaproteobacteria bacterium]|jgi:hypothetical protein